MSVEIEGPKGYDYHYLGTVLLILENLNKEGLEVYVEKENSEDSQIIFIENNIIKIVEVQFKRKSETITLSEFCKWICHFESRCSDNFLLNKVSDERIALFVTNFRCDDRVSKFVSAESDINFLPNVSFNIDFLDNLKTEMKTVYNDNKTLSKKRKLKIQEFCQNIISNNLRGKLKKIKVLENLTEDVIEQKIDRILNKDCFVSQSLTKNLRIILVNIIRNSRGKGISVIPEIINKIKEASSNLVLDKTKLYMARTFKETLNTQLNIDHVLLLSGVPFCGKTYFAKDLAQDYLEKGYEIKIGSDVKDASLFLTNFTNEDRLFILEDPFGPVKLKDDALNILKEIKCIIDSSTKTNRKLIITSRSDTILELNKKSLGLCNINHFSWNDLTETDFIEIEKLWFLYYGGSQSSKDIFKNIFDKLNREEKESSLQFGEIISIYHSYKTIEELELTNLKEIIDVARTESNEIARKIDQIGKEISKIFILLCLTCNTYRSVTITEFGSIINNDDIELTFCKDSTDGYPTYTENTNSINKNEIKQLINLGYIEMDNFGRIKFTHPIYYHAAKLLLKGKFIDIFDKEEAVNFFNKGLNSLNVNSNLCSLEVIQDIYLDDFNEELKEIMIKHLNSIYPSVRDKIIMFYDRNFEYLNEKEQTKLVQAMRNYKHLIEWQNGLPWIDPHKKVSNSITIGLFKKALSKEEIDLIMKKGLNKFHISSKEIWNLLESLPVENEFKILELALSYEESFIREAAIYRLFNKHAFNLEKIDKYLIMYEHHNYIYKLFRGAFDSWFDYSSEFKIKILNYFKESLKIISVCITAQKFFERFYKDYTDKGIHNFDSKQNAELWNVWYEVFTIFLDLVPEKFVQMYEPRMVYVIDESINHINDIDRIVNLATIWFDWIKRNKNFRDNDDYGMSVAAYLISGTKNNETCRNQLFDQMLKVNDTSLITSNLFHFVKNIKYLSDTEIKKILSLLSSDRTDIKWIKSILLQEELDSDDILKSILGRDRNYNNIEIFVDILIEKNLLEPCLNIYTGQPQPLWLNGYHHTNRSKWNKVILEILKRDSINQTFDISLEEFMDDIYNNSNRNFGNIYEFYDKYLLKDPQKRKKTFEKLLKISITNNQCNKRAWDMLFENSEKEELEIYFEAIVDNIEPIENNLRDLFELFEEDVVYKKIYSKLEYDNSIFLFVKKKIYFKNRLLEYSNSDSHHENIQKIIEDIKILDNLMELQIHKIYEDGLIRLEQTNNFVRFLMKEYNLFLGDNFEMPELLETNRIKLIDISHDKRKLFYKKSSLEGWYY